MGRNSFSFNFVIILSQLSSKESVIYLILNWTRLWISMRNCLFPSLVNAVVSDVQCQVACSTVPLTTFLIYFMGEEN